MVYQDRGSVAKKTKERVHRTTVQASQSDEFLRQRRRSRGDAGGDEHTGNGDTEVGYQQEDEADTKKDVIDAIVNDIMSKHFTAEKLIEMNDKAIDNLKIHPERHEIEKQKFRRTANVLVTRLADVVRLIVSAQMKLLPVGSKLSSVSAGIVRVVLNLLIPVIGFIIRTTATIAVIAATKAVRAAILEAVAGSLAATAVGAPLAAIMQPFIVVSLL